MQLTDFGGSSSNSPSICRILHFLTWFHVEQPDVVEDIVGPAEAAHDEDVVVVEEELGLPVTRRGPRLGDVPLVPHGGYVGQKEFQFNRSTERYTIYPTY